MSSNQSLAQKSFSLFQKIGKALMLPVSVLPIAGLLLGVGSAHFELLPPVVSSMMASSGDAIFSALPLLFAIGVALGLTNNDGVAALAASVGYGVLLASMGVMATALGVETKPVMGIATINTGVFGGILVGALAAIFFNRFYRVQLPPYLGFFAGKRAVPILTAFAAIFVGVLLSLIWPPIGSALSSFSKWAATENPGLAFTIYGVGERSLIPFGLHHIWNVPFFFETGSYTDPVTGKIVTGELARYLAGDPAAGNLAGGYLFKMWGLPAAALAMWHTARPENKKAIGGIMISAALTSFITGITEPIEFSFLFIAPLLYAVHALLSGLAFFVCIALGIKHGTTFSHGLIDYIILFPKSTQAWLLLVIGPLWALIYYTVFRYSILLLNLATPGREIETSTEKSSEIQGAADDSLPAQILNALGGKKNIKHLDACITRLRVELVHPMEVKPEQLKNLGASGVLTIGNSVQAIFGTKSEALKTSIEDLMSSKAETRNGSGLVDALGGKMNIKHCEVVALTRVRIIVNNPDLVKISAVAKHAGFPAQLYKGGVIHVIAGDLAKSFASQLI